VAKTENEKNSQTRHGGVSMNVKQTVKKMSAVAAGVFMVGLTVGTASALDLSEYPEPFVQDGAFQGKIVIGAQAQAADTLAAIDVATSLQASSVTPVDGSGSSVVVTGGEVFDEENLNNAIAVGELDSRDLEGFEDSTVSYDGSDVDYEEVFTASGLRVVTSLGDARSDEDFEGDAYLTMEGNSNVVYKVVFDDTFTNDAMEADTDELEIPFLGRDLEITGFDAGNDEITISSNQERFLTEGESVTVDGNQVELVRVGDGSVRVSVNGETRVISEGQEERFRDSDNFEVEVDAIFYIEGDSENGANLKLGDEITSTVRHGESAELFGMPSTDREAQFVWDIDFSEATDADTMEVGDHIGLSLNWDHLELDITDDREGPALAEGESLNFPNDYVSVNFDGLDISQYNDVEVEAFTDERLFPETGDSVDLDWGYLITTPGDDLIDVTGDNVSGTESGSEVFIGYNSDESQFQLWVYDGTDDILVHEAGDSGSVSWTGSTVALDTTDTINVVLPEGNLNTNVSNDYAKHLSFNFGGIEYLSLYVEAGNDYFGSQDDEEAGDLKYSTDGAGAGEDTIGNKDHDIMTTYGVMIEETESQFSSGSSFMMSVPDERQTASVSVTTQSSTRTSTGNDGGAYVVNPISTGAAILDSEATGLLGNTPLIVVGGPFVNTLASSLLDNPSEAEVEDMFESGLAKIRLFSEQNALLVAGFSATDTRGAGYVLANYQDFASQMTGTEVEVVVTDATTVQVRQPTN
jgi:hypothetical protein